METRKGEHLRAFHSTMRFVANYRLYVNCTYYFHKQQCPLLTAIIKNNF